MSLPDFATLNSDNIVAFIGDIFYRRGAETYLGENVTMSEHMLQAAQLAEQSGASDDIIAGALLHDIGHYTNEFPENALEQGTNNLHEEAGARVLERFFPSIVTDCVRQHVAAKRYLCATNPEYLARLSHASVHTLNLQGGPMSADEVAEFSELANLEAVLKVRIWDDQGKVAGRKSPTFEHYSPVLQRVVNSHMNAMR